MTSDVDTVYRKVIVIGTIYSFIVDTFFYLKSFIVLNIYFSFLDFEIQSLEISNDFEHWYDLSCRRLKILNFKFI